MATREETNVAVKMLRGLCVGYVVLFEGCFALTCAARGWELVYPLYQLQQLAFGLKSAAWAIAFLAVAVGVALGQRWARWLSLAFGVLGLGFSVFLLWEGLRLKSQYSGEEISEILGAIILSVTSLCVLAAMSVPAAKSYFYAKALSNPDHPKYLEQTS